MTNWQERLAKEFGSPEMRREMAVGRASAALSTLIAQRLAAKGMTQEQLAAALGITPGAVSRKLKEGCDMRLSSVAGILWALDVPLYREFERLCDEGWRVKSPPFAETASIVAEGASVPDEPQLREDLVHALSELDDFLDERHAAAIGHLAPTERRDAWRDLLADTLLDAHARCRATVRGGDLPRADRRPRASRARGRQDRASNAPSAGRPP